MTLQRILLPHLAIFHLKRTWGCTEAYRGPYLLPSTPDSGVSWWFGRLAVYR